MHSCSETQRVLADFVAEGEPRDAQYADLREHLGACPDCHEQLAYLRSVEVALRTMPRAMPSERLLRLLLSQALRENQLRQAATRGLASQLGWDVLAPLFTLVVALAITVRSMPPQVWLTVRQIALDTSSLGQPVPISELLQGSVVSGGYLFFWAMWIAMAVVLGGLGVSWALNAWSEPYAQRLDDLQHQVQDAAERLVHRI